MRKIIALIKKYYHKGVFHEAFGDFGDDNNYWTCCKKEKSSDKGCTPRTTTNKTIDYLNNK